MAHDGRVRLAAALALPVLALPAPALAGDPTMPLSQVEPGMTCEGRSVVKGTEISTFDVEVIDVIREGPPYLHRILARASGPAVDETGLGFGFSGSPVYCPGPGGPAVAGAVSEGLGDYGNKLTLLTPIEEILKEPAGPVPPAGIAGARPLAGPLTFTGVSAPFARLLGRGARRAGVPVIAVPGGSGPSWAPQDLQPGSSMAAGMSSGDLAVSSVGTVAYRDGDRIWGFGHPLDAFGARSLLLQDAYVHTVVPNPLGAGDIASYKLAAPGNDLGTVWQDGLTAVAGGLGPLPERTEVHVRAEDLDRGLVETDDTTIADETAIGLPGNVGWIAPLAIGDAAVAAVRGLGTNLFGTMCLRLKLRERDTPLEVCNRYYGDRTFPGALQIGMADDAAVATFLYDELASRRDVHLDSLSAEIYLRRGQRLLELDEVRAPRRARRGKVISIRVGASAPRGVARTFRFRIRVPRKLRPGRYRLVLAGGAFASFWEGFVIDEEVDFDVLVSRLLGSGELLDGDGSADGAVRSIADLQREIDKLHRYDGIRASFVRVRNRKQDRALELLEELLGDLDGEDRPKSRRVYRDADYGFADAASTRIRVKRRPRRARGA